MNRNSRSLAKPVRRLPLKPETALPALTTLAIVIGTLASGSVHANPTGGNVVGGAATITDRGNGTLDINQSTGKAIINWKDFSIGANETVNFRQPGSKSVTLNRVVGNDPSAIFGKLNANGTVMLVNPNGVVFGKGARIDVGGLVATTANINDKDFLAGNYKFNQASSKTNAAIINEGTISIKDSGLAALVAPSVRNSGVIEAKLGRVALAGAKTVTVDFHGDGLLSFDATSTVNELPKDASGKPVSALVTNTGTIVADGGTVLMTARAVKGVIDNVVNTDGIVSAKTVGTQNGKIVLSGGDAGTVKIAGKVDATGAGAGQQGGKVVVTGEHVDVTAKAAIDVSGSAGGGEIALGSLGVAPDDGSAAFSGKSSTVKVAAGATLKADARVKGNGGNVTMWSNEATAFAGSLSARGGEQGGDGGFAEISSKKNIGLTGSVDMRAPKGKTGNLLIDPTTLRIVSGNGGDQDGNASDGSVGSGDANTANNTVSEGLLESLAGNANITLEATGLITIASDIVSLDLKTTTGNTFTLRSTQAGGGITFENASTAITTQGGDISLTSFGTLQNVGKLVSNGGNIMLSGNQGIQLANLIDAGAGLASVYSSGGSISNIDNSRQQIKAGSVTLLANNDIGASSSVINTQTADLSLRTGLGNAHISNTGAMKLTATSGGAGSLNVTNNGDLTLGNVTSNNINLSTAAGSVLDDGNASTTVLTQNLTINSAGSIGTKSRALQTKASNSESITATLTAYGDIVLQEQYGLNVDMALTQGLVGDVALTADLALRGRALTAGLIVGKDISLTSVRGDILGQSANSIVATGGVTLASTWGTSRTIGTSATRLNTNTSSLSLLTPGSFYVDNAADLSKLLIDRRNMDGSGTSLGALSLTSKNLTGFDVLHSGANLLIRNITDTTGLDLTVRATDGMTVSKIDVTKSGSVNLETGLRGAGSNLFEADSVTTHITADTVTLNANAGTGASYIGSASGLRIDANHVSASASNGLRLTALNTMTLDDIRSGGLVMVQSTTAGVDLLVGAIRFGSLSLATTAGSILSNGGDGLIADNSIGNITVQANYGIGAADAALKFTTRGRAVMVRNTTNAGSIYVDALDSFSGGISTQVLFGNVQVTSAGGILLNSSATSNSALIGNDISLWAKSGDIVLNTSIVRPADRVSLQADQGGILLSSNVISTALSGAQLVFKAAGDIGTLDKRTGMIIRSPDATITSSSGSVYIGADVGTVLSRVQGNTIDVTGYGDLRVNSAAGSDIKFALASGRGGGTLTLGDINAGAGSIVADYSASPGSIADDGDAATRLTAGSIDLTARRGIGTLVSGTRTALNVDTQSLTAKLTDNGSIHIDNARTSPLTLTSAVRSGAIDIRSVGDIRAVDVSSQLSDSNTRFALTSSAGAITAGKINAGSSGTVSLIAQGAISAVDANSLITANTLALSAGGNIGTAAQNLKTSASELQAQVTGTGDLHLLGTGPMTLNGVQLDDGDISVASTGSLSVANALIAGNDGAIKLQATGGDVSLNYRIGDGNARSVWMIGDQILLNAGVVTSGGQIYDGNVRLIGDLTAESIRINGSLTLNGADHLLRTSDANGSIYIANALYGGNSNLQLQAGTGAVTLNAGASDLNSLVLRGQGSSVKGVQTVADQNYYGTISMAGTYSGNTVYVDGNATLTGDTDLQAVNGTFNGNVTGPYALTLNGSDSKRIGGTVDIGILSVGGDSTLQLNGGSVKTSSTQNYNSRVLLGRNTTLEGSQVRLRQGADGAYALNIDGAATLIGAIGANAALASLSIDGTAALNGSIATTGNQHYQGAVTLNGDQVLTTQTGNVTFDAKVGASGANLTVTSSNGGDITFAEIGARDIIPARFVTLAAPVIDRLGNLTVNTSGDTTFNGAVRAASVTTDAAGRLSINGGLVDTTDTQNYGERLVLGSNTELKGTVISLTRGIEGKTNGGQSLTITGNALLDGNIGTLNALASLSVSDLAVIGSRLVRTTGAQSYGDIALGNSVVIQTGGGNVTVSGGIFADPFNTLQRDPATLAPNLTVRAGAGNVTFAALGVQPDLAGVPNLPTDADVYRLGAIDIQSSGATTFGGAVRATSVTTDAAGTLAINGGTIQTTGNQVYGEVAVLGRDTTLTGTNVSLGGADSAAGANAYALTLAGNGVINGAAGANHALASLSISGTARLGGSINTLGAQSYQGNVTLTDALNITTDGGRVTFAGTVGNGYEAYKNLTVNAGSGDVEFQQGIGGHAPLVNRMGEVAINSSGATTIGGAVWAASLSTDAAGTLAMNGGRVNTTGDQFYGERMVIGSHLLMDGRRITLANGADGATVGGQNLSMGGDVFINGSIGTGNALANLNVAGTVTLGADDIITRGSQSYNGAVTLTKSLRITAGSGVWFYNTVASAANGGYDLILNAGTGDAYFARAIGNANSGRLGALDITSARNTTFHGTIHAASVRTDAAGTLLLDGGLIDTTGTQYYGEKADIGYDATLKGSSVTLANGAGSGALTIDGNAFIGGILGDGSSLASLNITGTATITGTRISTVGDQTYAGDVTFSNPLSIYTLGGDVRFGGTVEGSAALSIATMSGDVTFNDTVGASTALGALSIDTSGLTTFSESVRAASLFTIGTGGVSINGGSVSTVLGQSYAGNLALGKDTTLSGSEVRILAGANGNHALTIDGDAALGGIPGANTRLASLTVDGNTTFNGGTIATTGLQAYNGAVTLAFAQQLSTQSGDVVFGGAVNGGIYGTRDLSISSQTGNVNFLANVGHAGQVANLVVDTAGDIRFAGRVAAASVTTRGNGTVALDGASVSTTGAQSYDGAIKLGADTTLSGTQIGLLAGGDGAHALTIIGDAKLGGDLGATDALSSLSVSGNTTLAGGSVTTTGDQTYSGAVDMTGGHTLTSQTGSVLIASTLDGRGNNLSINAGHGIRVEGDAADLGALTLRAVDTIVFNGSVSAYRVQQLEAKSATYAGTLTASGEDGIDLTGGDIALGGDVTAEKGAIRIANATPTGTTTFAQGTTVRAATGFTQSGGAALLLPAQLLVTQGDIILGAPATLQGAAATIATQGNITAIGIEGANTTLTLSAGNTGALRIGANDANATHKINVAGLAVTSAGSADIYGAIAGKTGQQAAKEVNTALQGASYRVNGTTWGVLPPVTPPVSPPVTPPVGETPAELPSDSSSDSPADVINRVTASTAPSWVTPSTPRTEALFNDTVPRDAFGTNSLNAYRDPQVLTISYADALPAGTNGMLRVPSETGAVLQAPAQ